MSENEFLQEKIRLLEEQIRLQKEIITMLKQPKEKEYVPYYPPVNVPSVWPNPIITCKEPVITTTATGGFIKAEELVGVI